MALTSTAAVRAGNGLGGQTHIFVVATGTNVAVACTEAAEAGFTVAAVEGTANGDHIAIQGTGAAPTLTDSTLVVTFTD